MIKENTMLIDNLEIQYNFSKFELKFTNKWMKIFFHLWFKVAYFDFGNGIILIFGINPTIIWNAKCLSHWKNDLEFKIANPHYCLSSNNLQWKI